MRVSFAGACLETQAGCVSHNPTAGLQLSSKVTLGGLQELGSQVTPSPAHEIICLTRIPNRALNLMETANVIYGVFQSSGESGALIKGAF